MTRTVNGHEMEIFPAHDQSGVLEEMVFWCHTCDENGTGVVSVPVAVVEDIIKALKMLRVISEEHEKEIGIDQS
jgi:hypothetical protein